MSTKKDFKYDVAIDGTTDYSSIAKLEVLEKQNRNLEDKIDTLEDKLITTEEQRMTLNREVILVS